MKDAVDREQIQSAQAGLAKLKQAWGEHSTKLLPALFNLADTYFALGEYYTAEQLSWRALSIAHKAYGDLHEVVADCLQRVGEAQEAQELPYEAERFYLWSLSIRQKCSRSRDDLKPILSRLILLYRNNSLNFKAKVMEYKLIQTLVPASPTKAPKVLTLRVNGRKTA